jgi:hypothetical protein
MPAREARQINRIVTVTSAGHAAGEAAVGIARYADQVMAGLRTAAMSCWLLWGGKLSQGANGTGGFDSVDVWAGEAALARRRDH